MNVVTRVTKQRACLVCGGFSHALRIPSMNGYAIVRCQHCGLIFADPLPDAAELERHYAHYAPEAVENGTHSAKLVRDLLLTEAQRIGHDGTFGDLLDVGCGYGFFLQAMQGLCSTVTGIELSAGEAAYARQKLGLNVRQGTLAEAQFPDSCFDTVTMWEVIEHLPDPLGYLQEIRRILKPGGLLVISTPNACCLTAKVTGNHWRLWAPPEHLYYFCMSSLKRSCLKVGFRIQSAFTLGVDWFHLYVFLRHLPMSRGELLYSSQTRIDFDQRLRRMRLGWFLIRLANLVSYQLFRYVPLGDSLHVYARKV